MSNATFHYYSSYNNSIGLQMWIQCSDQVADSIKEGCKCLYKINDNISVRAASDGTAFVFVEDKTNCDLNDIYNNFKLMMVLQEF